MIASGVITIGALQHEPAPSGDSPPWTGTESSLRRVYASVAGLGTPHTLDAMVSPPNVVVTGSVSDPSGMGVAYTHLSGSAVPHCKGGGRETVGGGYRRFPVATLAAGSVIGVTWRVSLRTASPRVAFCLGGTTAANYRFLVRVAGGEERYVSKAGTAVKTDSFVVLDFGSPADRIVSVENQDTSAFRSVNVDTGHDATNPNESGIALFLGDSLTNATRGPAPRCDGLVHCTAELLGLRNPWASGVGGTGYVATSYGTRHKLADRIEADIGRAKEIDTVVKVFVLMGSNDIGLPGVNGEARRCFDQIRALLPAASVSVASPFDRMAPNDPGVGFGSVKAAIRSAVAGRGGFHFLDLEGVAYSKTDSVHADAAGALALGRALARAERAALGAGA